MNRLKFLAVVFTALVMGLGIYSCQKETKIIENENISSSVKSRTNVESSFSSIDFPLNNEETERLVFRNEEHFNQVYFQLDELESENLETSNGETFEDFIFSYLKFNSVFKRKFFDGFTDPNERYKPFLADGIMSMLVNEHYEFQIEDYVYTYINNRYFLVSHVNNVNALLEIRALMDGKAVKVNEIVDNIPEGSFLSDAIDPEVISRNKRKFCKCEISIEITDCNTATISGNCKNLVGESGSGTINVSIENNGISTPIPVIINMGINGNFSTTITLNSTTTRINAHVKSGCSAGSGDDSDIINIPFGNFCDMMEERETGWQWTQNPNEALDYNVRKSHTWLQNKIEAEVYSKIWTGTKWENQRRKLRASADEVRRNINCFQQSTHSNTDICNNCTRRIAKISHGHSQAGPPAHCDGDVIGSFHKDIFGLSLNATGSIDFKCCIR